MESEGTNRLVEEEFRRYPKEKKKGEGRREIKGQETS